MNSQIWTFKLLSWVEMSSKCNQGILVQIVATLEDSKQIQSNSIEFQIRELPWILIWILKRILKNSYKENCSLFHFLHIHILFENFWATEDHFWSNQIQISLEKTW
jgi:hypothetical protein